MNTELRHFHHHSAQAGFLFFQYFENRIPNFSISTRVWLNTTFMFSKSCKVRIPKFSISNTSLAQRKISVLQIWQNSDTQFHKIVFKILQISNNELQQAGLFDFNSGDNRIPNCSICNASPFIFHSLEYCLSLYSIPIQLLNSMFFYSPLLCSSLVHGMIACTTGHC